MSLLIGPTGSGKTLLLKRLQILHESKDLSPEIPFTIPTVGTNLVNVQLQKKQEVTVRELGGSMSPIWPNFFKDAKNIIFLLDLSNRLQVSAACIQLLTTLSHKSLVNSRFLVLLNKVDSVSVMTKTEFESLFRWSEIVKHCKQNVTLLEISALTGHNLDAIINWLQQNYSSSPS